jgi:hypothetical protein
VRRPVTAKAKGFRRVERWLVGIAMTIAAVVLERIVMRQVKKGRAEAPEPTTVTSRGGEVDI